jgi:adenosylmethionine-8-amino-7-oxononanoate aminotransferase
MTLSTRDKKLIWHPFTQEQNAALPLAITSAAGSYVYDEQGRPYIDLISSWWVNLHGHAHPEIAQAIYEQALTLEHVMFAGFTHEPAVKLCEGLAHILPPTLSRYFFSDNGSTSVEAAIKMAYQYWWNQQAPHKTLFLSFAGGYHGDTFGAMSVGAQSGFHAPFSPFLFKVLTLPFPATWEDDEKVEQKEKDALTALEKCLDAHPGQIAAMIIEPLVQGAAGMRICRPSFMQALVNLLQTHHILVIFDEVMTGFYRTGSYFALDQTKVVPDFLCLSKGLTGGFLPLALTITTDQVYQAFLGEHYSQAFSHGHSYTANPLGCAAANASLALLKNPATKIATQMIQQAHRQGLQYLQENCPSIQHIRLLGTIAAFDLPQAAPFHVNTKLSALFLKQGLLLRPLGATVYLLPPYSIKANELEEVYEKIKDVLQRHILS